MIRSRINNLGQATAHERAVTLSRPIIDWFLGTENMLDFGCGLGHLGYNIANTSGAKLVSLDIKEYPFTHPKVKPIFYDGKHLPFREKQFDTTLIAYTLHHLKKPEVLLAEAKRVTRKHIVVCEDRLFDRRMIPVEFIKDILANYLRPHPVFQYRTVDEWELLFSDMGFNVLDRIFHESGKIIHLEHVSWNLSLHER